MLGAGRLLTLFSPFITTQKFFFTLLLIEDHVQKLLLKVNMGTGRCRGKVRIESARKERDN
jgi:hypothetical protein